MYVLLMLRRSHCCSKFPLHFLCNRGNERSIAVQESQALSFSWGPEEGSSSVSLHKKPTSCKTNCVMPCGAPAPPMKWQECINTKLRRKSGRMQLKTWRVFKFFLKYFEVKSQEKVSRDWVSEPPKNYLHKALFQYAVNQNQYDKECCLHKSSLPYVYK